jgi:hypothetical protein
VDELKAVQNSPLTVCESLDDFVANSHVPAFFARWWYVGSADNMSNREMAAFEKLLKAPTEYGLAILVGTDYRKYSKLARYLRNATQSHEITASFPSRRYLVGRVMRGMERRGYSIAPGAADEFVRRMGVLYASYDFYLDQLVAQVKTGIAIRKEDVAVTLKGVTGASFDDFIEALVRPLSAKGGEIKRANKMFKSYAAIIEGGAVKALQRVHRRAVQCLEVRRLINEGYVPVGFDFPVESLARMLGDPPEWSEDAKKPLFTRWDTLSWSDWKLKREVALAASTSLADWWLIVFLSARRCYTDTEAEIAFYDILTRSRRTWDDLLAER